MANFNNISSKLCNFCGTCVGVCPVDCLSLDKEKIVFDEKKCINCGLCFKNCQGVEFDFPKARKIFNRRDTKFNELIGSYDSFFIAQTKDQDILKDSSSGGLVPTVLMRMLEKKLVDGAILIAKNKKSPLGYKIIIAKTREDVLQRCQSLYQLVPLNSILKKIGKSDLKNLAFVGLPCHVEAIRKLQMSGNETAKKIKLILGLFCGLTQSFSALELVFRKLKIRKEDIVDFSYRGGAWPGGLYIKTKDKEYFLGKEGYEFMYYMFAPRRCLLCYDYTNEFADASFGDAWSKQPSKGGWSEVIVRNKLIKDILLDLKKESKIVLEESNLDKLLESRPGHISLKKKGIFYRLRKMKPSPRYGIEQKKFGPKVELFQKMMFFFIMLMHSKLVKTAFFIFPLSISGSFISILRKVARFAFFKKKRR